MAVFVSEVTQQRKFKYSTNEPNGTAEYYVYFESDTGDPVDLTNYPLLTLLALAGIDPNSGLAIPQEGEQLGSFPTFVDDVTASLKDKQNGWWTVEVEYATPESEEEDSGGSFGSDPRDDAVTYRWSSKNIRVKKWVDAVGIPIVMSSGNPPSTFPLFDEAILICTVGRKTDAAAYNPLTALTVLNKINAALFTLNTFQFAIETVKCITWASTQKVANVTPLNGDPKFTTLYNDETLVYEIKLDPWKIQMMDIDSHSYADSASGDTPQGKHHIKRNGVPVKKPEPLNGEGLPIFDDEGEVANSPVARAISIPNLLPGVLPINGVAGAAPFKGALLEFYGWAPGDFTIFGAL